MTNLSHEPVKTPRYNTHCFDVILIFPNSGGPYILLHLSNVKIDNIRTKAIDNYRYGLLKTGIETPLGLSQTRTNTRILSLKYYMV